VQHILGPGLLDQEPLVSHTLEVGHPHNRDTLELHHRAIQEPHPLASQEPHLRAIQEPHVLDSQEHLLVKDMGELHHLSSRAILVVVPTLVMEEPHPHSHSLDMEELHPHSLATEHNLSKAILELHPPSTRVTVLPLNNNRWILKLRSGSELSTRTGVDRLMPRNCKRLWSMATGATSARKRAG